MKPMEDAPRQFPYLAGLLALAMITFGYLYKKTQKDLEDKLSSIEKRILENNLRISEVEVQIAEVRAEVAETRAQNESILVEQSEQRIALEQLKSPMQKS